ncbi:hypothetical protein HHK36_005619 [Tetracentron sinense]|uniref:Calponin-homology (CH) domain-containing protein n=1 Tax=Tetracentron sinense TaxID=13715 RepID=A0A834ZLS1_TETSI|nr:hypothetical protein HHK36_005619 [Tetracentron sinense]
MEGGQPSPSPSPSPNPSTFLRDISNFKTPKHSSQNPNFHSPFPQFFTASKQTPSSSSSAFHRRRPSIAPSSRSKATRRLKAFELEQSQSSRKAQIRKEKSLRSLSKSLSVWLNFLFENPKSCGCNVSGLEGGGLFEESTTVLANGKRDSWPGVGVGIDRAWRNPKRQRDCSWRPMGSSDAEPLSSCVLHSLQESLQEVCSFEDLKRRMGAYLSLESCKEVFSVMTQVVKNIDEGRLKMKAHCPIVTDFGMKEKATRTLMCYNPTWLRIGMYIVFGGDSLLPNGDVNSDQEVMFLKMVIEKQFFSHAGLAKAYAYNKLVEGLYRPGYFEALGNIILKRFLLLVLILDRAKCQSSLPIKYGIDGIDGGSPLLFSSLSNIKTSRQVIQDFLSSEVMHGEGNLLAHLVIVGYKVSYQQSPLLEYDFRVTDLFDDLQDGVRLCRAIHLLQHDTSILAVGIFSMNVSWSIAFSRKSTYSLVILMLIYGQKLVVPSDTRKKNLVNCGIAMQYLKQAVVPLSDEDGVMIVAEDVANGEKELTLSLLWNMFVHLQLPLLINKTLLHEEISKFKGADTEYLKGNTSNPLEMVLEWIQVICQKYDIKIDCFASLLDGKALWCLVDYYFRKALHCSCSYKDAQEVINEKSILLATDNTDTVHNFVLLQKLTTLLGNFPEVLQISDILEHNGACNEQSVIIMLVFLSSQLICRKNTVQLNIHKFLGCNCQSPETKRLSLERCFLNSEALVNQAGSDEYSTEDAVKKFKAIQAWWRDMAKQNNNCETKPDASALQYHLANKHNSEIQRERAAKFIQSHFRGSTGRRNFLKIKIATSFLQTVIRAWLTVKWTRAFNELSTVTSEQLLYGRGKHSESFGRYFMFMVDRHGFVRLKKSVVLIQRAARTWICRRHQSDSTWTEKVASISDIINAAIVVQSYIRGMAARSRYAHMVAQVRKSELTREGRRVKAIQIKAAIKIQLAWKKFTLCNSLQNEYFAATKIQCHIRGWLMRRTFLNQRKAIIKIQSGLRDLRCRRAFQQYKTATRSAIIIQSHIRGWVARRVACRERHLIIVIQSHWRGCLTRRHFFFLREAVIKIQSALRCLNCWRAFQSYRHAAIEIQRFARGQIARNRLLGASCLGSAIHSDCMAQISRSCIQSLELKILLHSVLKMQRWWKRVLLLKSRTKSAVVIQSHIRGWIARRKATRERHRIVVIQSYWKGYLARKESRGQLLDLRLRVLKSASNVDNDMRLINRLVTALSELLSIRSVSSILHTCETLDMATEHSQICCETLVTAGAIGTLLKLIRSVSRSIPDQEVVKHALSTLRNLARYPHLAEVLVDTHKSIETILWEFLRNKEEGYFIASEILRKLCSTQKGVETVRKLPAFMKRLHNLIEDLKRKASNEKRNTRPLAQRDSTERRLREAVELLKLTTNG